MKAIKITFWTSTIILGLMMIYSAWMYFTNPLVGQAFEHLGFPAYFRIELGVAKLIGAVLLFIPGIANIKQWVYAGFGICFISAFVAHTAAGDPLSVRIMPLLFFVILVVSYMSRTRATHAVQYTKANYDPE